MSNTTEEVTSESPSVMDEFMRLDKIIREGEEAIAHANRLKADGRWKAQWDGHLAVTSAELEKATRERNWLDGAVARYAAAQR